MAGLFFFAENTSKGNTDLEMLQLSAFYKLMAQSKKIPNLFSTTMGPHPISVISFNML
jgi:hypothetical protein